MPGFDLLSNGEVASTLEALYALLNGPAAPILPDTVRDELTRIRDTGHTVIEKRTQDLEPRDLNYMWQVTGDDWPPDYRRLLDDGD